MSAEGSLVTWHWGEDIVTHIKNASGLDTEVVALDDLDDGHSRGVYRSAGDDSPDRGKIVGSRISLHALRLHP